MREETIKTKIAVDGEKAYKQACREINGSLKELGSEMKLVTAEYARNASSTEALQAKSDVLKRQFDEQARKVQEAEKALKSMRAAGVDPTSEAYRRMQTRLNDAKTDMAKTRNALDETTESLKVGRISWDDFADAAGKAGKMAAGAVAALGTAAFASGIALAGMTVSAASFADDLLTLSANTHIATEDIQKYQYALRFIDGDFDALSKTMRKTAQNMDAARDGNSKLNRSYEALGVSITNVDGSLRDSQDVYWEVIDALGKVENVTERDVLSMELLGKSGTELNTIIDAGSKAFKDLGEEAERMGVVMGEDALNAMGAFDDKMQQLKASMGGLKNSAGLIAMPFLDTMASKGVLIIADFSQAIQNANGDLESIGDAIGEGLAGIIDLIVESTPDFLELGLGLVESFTNGIVENSGKVATAAIRIVKMLVDSVSELAPKILTGGAKMLTTFVRGVAEALPQLVPQLAQVVVGIVNSMLENLPALVVAGVELIAGLVKGIVDAIPLIVESIPLLVEALISGLLGALPELTQTWITLLTSLVEALPRIIFSIVEALPVLIDSIIAALLDALPLLIDAYIKLMLALIDALPRIIAAIIAAVPRIVDGITSALIENIDKLVAAGVQLFVALIQNLPQIVLKIVAAVPRIVGGVVDSFGGLMYRMVEVGGNLLAGIWQGISGAAGWLWEKVSQWAQSLVDGIMRFFGIQSPSKVFAEIGGFMVQGLGVGFDGGTREAQEKMLRSARSIQTALYRELQSPHAVDLSVRGNTAEHGKRGGTAAGNVYVTQNIYASDTSYVGQQREAAKRLQRLAREVYA